MASRSGFRGAVSVVLRQCDDLGLRAALCRRVVVAGGVAATPGLADRVTAEVAAAAADLRLAGGGSAAVAVATAARGDCPGGALARIAGTEAWRGGGMLAYSPSTLYASAGLQHSWGFTPWACW